MSAAFHRAVALDTRISVAIAELTVGSRIDRKLQARLGIDLAPVIATLEHHLETLRAELHRMTDDPYPQQPGLRVIGERVGEFMQRIVDGRGADLDLARWADDGGAPC